MRCTPFTAVATPSRASSDEAGTVSEPTVSEPIGMTASAENTMPDTLYIQRADMCRMVKISETIHQQIQRGLYATYLKEEHDKSGKCVLVPITFFDGTPHANIIITAMAPPRPGGAGANSCKITRRARGVAQALADKGVNINVVVVDFCSRTFMVDRPPGGSGVVCDNT